MRASALRAAAAAALALALGAAPAAADWLVLTDGTRVETRGTWEVRGGLVVFTLGNGTLSSLRASEVDLAASAAATEAANRPAAPAPPPPRPKARVVLTEKDLPPVSQAPAAAEAAAETGAETEEWTGAAAAAGAAETPAAPAPAAPVPATPAPATPPAGDPRLAVADWKASTPDDFDGTVIAGRLRNAGDQLLTRALVEVLVYNAAGTLLGRAAAQVPPGPMAPGRVIEFEARFPSVYGVADARFDARGVGFLEADPEGENQPPSS